MRVCVLGEGVGGSKGMDGGAEVGGVVWIGAVGSVRVRRAEGRRISSMPSLGGFLECSALASSSSSSSSSFRA